MFISGLSGLSTMLYYLDYYYFMVSFEVIESKSSNLILLNITLAIVCHLHFQVYFRIILLISWRKKKKPAKISIRMGRNLRINLGKINTAMILSFSIQNVVYFYTYFAL